MQFVTNTSISLDGTTCSKSDTIINVTLKQDDNNLRCVCMKYGIRETPISTADMCLKCSRFSVKNIKFGMKIAFKVLVKSGYSAN